MKIKTTLLTVAVAALAASTVIAEDQPMWPQTVFSGYRLVSATSTNAGDTGLTSGVAYVCFAMPCLTNQVESGGLTEVQASPTGVVWQVMYSICQRFYTSWLANNAFYTNYCTVSRSATWTDTGAAAAEGQVIHALRIKRTATGAE
jgi:hypothetical protein